MTQSSDSALSGLRRIARHRLAPLVLVAILALLTLRTCQAETVESTLELEFGPAAADVREVRGELLRPDESEAIGSVVRSYGDGGAPGPLRWDLEATPGSYELELDVVMEGSWVEIERGVEIRDRAVVTVDLEPSLEPSLEPGHPADRDE